MGGTPPLDGFMTSRTPDPQAPDGARLTRLTDVNNEALLHARTARELAGVRRGLLRELIADGYTQADLAHHLDVTPKPYRGCLRKRPGW